MTPNFKLKDDCAQRDAILERMSDTYLLLKQYKIENLKYSELQQLYSKVFPFNKNTKTVPEMRKSLSELKNRAKMIISQTNI